MPNSVTSIEDAAFANCQSLTNVTIGNSVTYIGDYAFYACSNLSSVYFECNAPSVDSYSFAFYEDNNVIGYYLPGTTGWSAFSATTGLSMVLWNPEAQTGDGSFGVLTNGFGFNIAGTENIPIVVEASTNFGGGWVQLQSLKLTNGSFYFSDPQWTNYPGRYYRLRSP